MRSNKETAPLFTKLEQLDEKLSTATMLRQEWIAHNLANYQASDRKKGLTLLILNKEFARKELELLKLRHDLLEKLFTIPMKQVSDFLEFQVTRLSALTGRVSDLMGEFFRYELINMNAELNPKILSSWITTAFEAGNGRPKNIYKLLRDEMTVLTQEIKESARLLENYQTFVYFLDAMESDPLYKDLYKEYYDFVKTQFAEKYTEVQKLASYTNYLKSGLEKMKEMTYKVRLSDDDRREIQAISQTIHESLEALDTWMKQNLKITYQEPSVILDQEKPIQLLTALQSEVKHPFLPALGPFNFQHSLAQVKHLPVLMHKR
jgi:hypothetical protein